jgi:type I restriction enzyme M protein
MNPPFSLEEWGYDDFIGGDSYDRFGFGTPPRDNGDYAWLLQVVKSLKATGKAIVVMSQGVLFRGQPAQTEREDGRNQKADSEYTIREAFVKADLIESIIILPSKLFYGNNVPGCLVVLSKRKASERKGKILLVWASRDYQASNPQNLLRRVDCMRVLAVWKAFGHLERCKATIPAGEAAFLREVEKEHAARLQEIEDAYAPDLITLAALRKKLEELELLSGSPAPQDKKEKAKHREQKKLITEKAKQVKREIKRLGKLELEAEQLKVAARDEYGGEQRLIKETAANMLDICSNTEEARRHFAVVDVCELASNDFNLNVPRYVDTPDVDAPIPLSQAAPSFKSLADNFEFGTKSLMQVLGASLSNER